MSRRRTALGDTIETTYEGSDEHITLSTTQKLKVIELAPEEPAGKNIYDDKPKGVVWPSRKR